MHVWIINPFDQLPNETDVPLRYWALCRTFAEQGHEVIWWSSDFSHLYKKKRSACPDTDGFSVRLIETPPYTKNISFARLKNHKAFAKGFYRDAMAGLTSGELKAPDRIVVSLPPLGVAEAAFSIREYLQKADEARQRVDGKPSAGCPKGMTKRVPIGQVKEQVRSQKSDENAGSAPTIEQNSPTPHLHSHPHSTTTCQVVVDIMDAWPETFYQALPKPLRKILGPILLAPLHRSAKRAYQGADKISAVGQSYLELAKGYLKRSRVALAPDSDATAVATENRALKHPVGHTHPDHAPLGAKEQASQAKPMHLCYHGTDLARFAQKPAPEGIIKARRQRTGSAGASRTASTSAEPTNQLGAKATQLRNSAISHQPQPCETESFTRSTSHPHSHSSLSSKPLSAVYLGSMGQGYDLETIIDVAARWKAEGSFPFQIHFAGDGPQREALEARAAQLGLTSHKPSAISHQSSLPKAAPSVINDSERIVFHGFLQKEAINELLLTSHVALVPNRPDSLVACPYKAGEYAAAGLPILSCLGGELGDLLDHWNAGSRYNEGDAASLHAAFKNYSTDLDLLKQQRLNTRKMAEALFDRKLSYQKLTEFILGSNSLSNSIGSARWRS